VSIVTKARSPCFTSAPLTSWTPCFPHDAYGGADLGETVVISRRIKALVSNWLRRLNTGGV
jgi:hypothetical protein